MVPVAINFQSRICLGRFFTKNYVYFFFGLKYKVHSAIVKLQGRGIDWSPDSCPFNNLSEDVLGTILHFLYAECLPENLLEATIHEVLKIVTPYSCLSKLVNKCNLYLKNIALKQRKYGRINSKTKNFLFVLFLEIIGLVNDMHGNMNQIIEHFNIKNNHTSSESITSNPAKLCFVVKQSIRDAAVGNLFSIITIYNKNYFDK